MDQAVIALAQPGAALLFDCSNHRSSPDCAERHRGRIVTSSIRDVRVNWSIRRTTPGSRKRAPRQGRVGVEHRLFATLDVGEFESRCTRILDPVVQRRARHVVSESARVARVAAALEAREPGRCSAVQLSQKPRLVARRL
jgi:galactokinase